MARIFITSLIQSSFGMQVVRSDTSSTWMIRPPSRRRRPQRRLHIRFFIIVVLLWILLVLFLELLYLVFEIQDLNIFTQVYKMINNILMLLLFFNICSFSFYCRILIFQYAFHNFRLICKEKRLGDRWSSALGVQLVL